MNANKVKCHFIDSKNKHVSIKIDDIELERSDFEKLLGIKNDSKRNFIDHLDEIIKKTTQKVNVLSRITPYLNIECC